MWVHCCDRNRMRMVVDDSIGGVLWRRRALQIALSSSLLVLAVFAVASLAGKRSVALDGEDPKQEASEKLHQWFGEVQQMEAEVRKFQADATQKSVDELVELARVNDLLQTLQAQVPVYTTPTPVFSWDYSKGPYGPANWATLSPDFTMCGTGKNQSPINIELDLQAAELPSLAWQLPDSSLHVRANRGGSIFPGREFYNGHTFEVQEMAGPTMAFNGVQYTLQEFHFHTPSEHQVAGRRFDAEVQFVHVAPPAADGSGGNSPPARFILSAFFQQGERSPAFLEKLMLQATTTTGNATGNPQPEEPVDLNFASISQSILVGTVPFQSQTARDFVPNFKNYFQYEGSLSSPPCTEGVTWAVLKNPIDMAAAHLAALAALEGPNARPIQPLNARTVLDVAGR